MKRRVLLTGAGGFVGHHTLEHILATTDWEVVCTDSFRHAGKVDRISEVLESNWQDEIRATNDGLVWVGVNPWKDRVTVITQDLTVPFSAQTADKIGHIDYIISMASESHVDRSITHPVDFITNNVQLILNLLEYHRTYNPQALFLQVSTDEVYGPAPQGHNHREYEPHYPSNPYSASKSAQESIAFSYWRTFGTPLILTNTMNIIGERQDPEKFAPMVMRKVLNNEVVSIHGSPGGKPGSRYYLHARNQADALLYLLKAFSGETLGPDRDLDIEYSLEGLFNNGETMTYGHNSVRPPKFHIVGEREVDNLEMAELIAQSVGMRLYSEVTDFHSSRPGHDLRYALDGSKIASLGWKAPVPFEESLDKTVKWTLENDRWLL